MQFIEGYVLGGALLLGALGMLAKSVVSFREVEDGPFVMRRRGKVATHAAGLLWVSGIGHFIAGNVDLHAVGWLLIGSIPGVLLGSQYMVHVGDRILRILLSMVLFASGAKLVAPNGDGWLVAAGAYVVFAVVTLRLVRLRYGFRVATAAHID